MKKLPISIQSFAELRTEDCVYVDKTEFIYQIIKGGKAYFLSRPRRFGKSLTIMTLKELFSGRKELFARQNPSEKDLWIYDKWDWTKTNPVIHIPFAKLGYKEMGLEAVLLQLLQETAEQYNVKITSHHYTVAFDELIKVLKKEIGRVVILIDEYDKPIIDFLETKNKEISKANRDKLRDFYRCIKDNDENIELFFMTGVSRFSQTGIFSHLNHLNDITIDDNYSTLLGITPTELLENFEEELQAVEQKLKITRNELLQEIKEWYNGYSWDGITTVYNPFSLINFFSKREFREFWFQSGSPKFLIDLLRENPHYNFNQLHVPKRITDSYEIEDIEIRALLFQTGYLTIKEYDRKKGIYTLDYPNKEVEQAMQDYLIGLLLDKQPLDSVAPVFEIENGFLENDVEKVVKVIKTLLKDVPSHLIETQNERFYHALVHLHFRYLGWYLDSEVHTSDGRMDAVVKTETHIYILEFKINKSGKTALKQIKEKDYVAKFGLEKREIVAVGINFDTKKKTVSSWAKEVLFL